MRLGCLTMAGAAIRIDSLKGSKVPVRRPLPSLVLGLSSDSVSDGFANACVSVASSPSANS